MKPSDALAYLAINHQTETQILDDDGPNLIWLDALDAAIKALEKQLIKPPEHVVKDGYECLGRTHYCRQCGAMFPAWDYDAGKTNYCGNCGQKLREAER